MNKLDLSPSIDISAQQLFSRSDTILSRSLYAALRSHGYTTAESLRIIHHHNEYHYLFPYDSSPIAISHLLSKG